MKHWILSLALCLCGLLLLGGLCGRVEAATIVDSGSCGDDLRWVLDSEGVLTISGTGEIECNMYSGNAPWYSRRLSIKRIVIENGATSIGSSVFDGCANLTSVTIPESVIDIGSFAFQYCASLSKVDIPNNVKNIGGSAFEGCTSLASINIPSGITNNTADVGN